MAATPVSSVLAEVTAIFTRDLHIEVPSPDADLLATGRLDSVAMVELLLQLEKHFGLRVDMEDLEVDHFRSIAAIAAFIAARRSGGHSALTQGS
jgi:acyl carrier protein